MTDLVTIISDERLAERGVEVLKRIAASKMPLADADFIAQWVHDARQSLRAQGGVASLEASPAAAGYTAEDGLRRVREIALQSEAAPLSMGEIIKVVDMALAEKTPFPDWLTAGEASPAPVSEEVTDQMVEIACKVFIPHWETCTAEVRSDVFGDMRSALTAALAAKGGQ